MNSIKTIAVCLHITIIVVLVYLFSGYMRDYWAMKEECILLAVISYPLYTITMLIELFYTDTDSNSNSNSNSSNSSNSMDAFFLYTALLSYLIIILIKPLYHTYQQSKAFSRTILPPQQQIQHIHQHQQHQQHQQHHSTNSKFFHHQHAPHTTLNIAYLAFLQSAHMLPLLSFYSILQAYQTLFLPSPTFHIPLRNQHLERIKSKRRRKSTSTGSVSVSPIQMIGDAHQHRQQRSLAYSIIVLCY